MNIKIVTRYKIGRQMIVVFLSILLAVSVAMCELTSDNMIVTIIVVMISILLSVALMKRNNDGYLMSLSACIFAYTVFTQFGLIIPYTIWGSEVVADYSNYVQRFLHSPYLSKAVWLGNVAIIAFSLGTYYGSNNENKRIIRISVIPDEYQESRILPIIGLLMILIVFFFYVFYLMTGQISLRGTYRDFINSGVRSTSLYPYILLMYACGIVLTYVLGNRQQKSFGFIIWGLTAVILFLTGNKGEVFYAALALLGVWTIKGNKMSLKMIIVLLIVLFVLIPLITSTRNSVGVASGFSIFKIEWFDAFAEMGMQLRMSVYTFTELDNKTIGFLFGKSYYIPFVNMIDRLIPFVSFNSGTATSQLRALYPGAGYQQVIESYLNFGVIGTIVFFWILGFMFRKHEFSNSKVKIALCACLSEVFVNASRNYFAFVPGQCLLIIFIFWIAHFVDKPVVKPNNEE